MSRLSLDRPLVFFDLETTGISTRDDRIVELSAVRMEPGAESSAVLTRRVNPGCPIPEAAAAIHGIRDADVADAPGFAEIADEVEAFFAGADLSGFNLERFDLPLLERELGRTGRAFSLENRRIIDVLRIFRRLEPRTLEAAVQRFLGVEHEGAHGAEADTVATQQVLLAMLERHPELPGNPAELAAWVDERRLRRVDAEARLVLRGGETVLGFGKHAGSSLREMAGRNRGYLEWILRGDFSETVKSRVREALDGASRPDRSGGD